VTGAALAAGLEPCVHCGFCLQACPTYLVTGDEADSPRGRIALIRGLAGGRLETRDPQLQTHLDRCLGCRACEPVCPSGVSYAPALEATRSRLADERPIPLSVRAVHSVMAERSLGRLIFPLARAVRPLARWLAGSSRFGMAFGMLAATRPRQFDEQMDAWQWNPEPPPADSLPPRKVVVFAGCVQDGLFGHVHRATARVLEANGYAVIEVPGQGCCGALHAHAGQHDDAVQLARHNVRALAELPEDALIAVDAAGCGAMLKEYGRLLAGDPMETDARRVTARTRDVSELLAERGPRKGAPLSLRVAYDPPCHLLHAQGIANEPRQLLDAVHGLEHVSHVGAELCCGSAGSYSLAQPGLSRQVLGYKVEAIRRAQPDIVATGNPGCAMQIGAGLLAAGEHIPVVHPVELLDWSYRRAGYYGE
jgi:glycolate oxidase iron-sulfur subunit